MASFEMFNILSESMAEDGVCESNDLRNAGQRQFVEDELSRMNV